MSYNNYLEKLAAALTDEFARIEDRMFDLIDERQPSKTTELITDFENEFDLPEVGTELGSTLDERRSDIITRLTAIGGQHKGYYIDIVDNMTENSTGRIYIGEFTPLWVDEAYAGSYCGDQKVIFYFAVGILRTRYSIPGNTGTYFFEIIPELIDKYKPAHTIALYNFYGGEFSQAFSSAFRAIFQSPNAYFGGAFNRDFNVNFDIDKVVNPLPKEFAGEFNWAFSNAFNGWFWTIT